MWPTRASSAACSSPSSRAFPCSTILAGSKPARRARCSSPAEATSQPRPSCSNSAITAVAGKAFDANSTSKSSCPAARKASMNERARARRSSSATMYAGVPKRSASSMHVAAADLQAAVRVDAAAERVDVREGLHRGHRASDYRGRARRPSSARAHPTRRPRRLRQSAHGLQAQRIRTGRRAPGPDGVHDVPARPAVRRAGRRTDRRQRKRRHDRRDRRRAASDSSSSPPTRSRWRRSARMRCRPPRSPSCTPMIERLCIQADLPKPRVAVIEARMPNACALGRSQKTATVCATRGSWRCSSRPSSRA